MKCTEIQDKLTQFYEGELSQKEKSLFEEHLSVCKTCAQDYEVFKTAVVAMGSLEDIEAPPDIYSNISRKIDRLEKRDSLFAKFFSSKTLMIAPQMASVVLFVVMGVMVYQMYGVYNKTLEQDMGRSDRMAQIDLPDSEKNFEMESLQSTKGKAESNIPKSGLRGSGAIARSGGGGKISGSGLGIKGPSAKDRKIQMERTPLVLSERAPVKEEKKIISKPSSGLGSQAKRDDRIADTSAVKASVNERYKDGDIEVIPLRRNHEVMGKEIESLVITSNGRIIRVKRGPKAPQEMLISIPSESYSNFMKRLREAMKNHAERKKLMMDKDKRDRLNKSMRLSAPPKKAPEPMDYDEFSVESKAQSESEDVSPADKTSDEKAVAEETKSKKKIPQVRLIKVVYE